MPLPLPKTPAIAVEDLECGYDGNILLQHVSFTVNAG